MDKLELDRSLFTEDQLGVIDAGIREGLDVSIYADPRYDYEQMRAIWLGLQDGLDVSIYANPLIPEFAMHITKHALRRIAKGLPAETVKYMRVGDCGCECGCCDFD